MAKYNASLRNVSIVPARSIWPERTDLEGRFVATGQLVREDDDRAKFGKGSELRTSLLVHVDIKAGTIETLNTVYTIVP